jgi:peptide-methionine (R)-S-oxide reductase
MLGGGGQSRMTMAIMMLGMAAVLCIGLAVMTRYAKVQIAQKKPDAGTPKPAGAFDERIKSLSREAYFTTQRDGDENFDPRNTGRWVSHTAPGVYLDVVSDRVLFTSRDKLGSIEGFAEFRAPAVPDEIEEIPRTPPLVRVRSRTAGTWLGRVADDRLQPGSRRYIINSTALNFVPAAELEARGLGEWRRLFQP